MVEIYREVAEDFRNIYIDLVDSKHEAYSPSRLAREIAKEYCVDSEALLNSVSGKLERYNLRRSNYIVVTLKKDHKTADELKREIRRVTRDLEKLVQTLIDTARELREQQDLTDWIWTRAKYDPEKRRFVKVDF